MPPPINRGLLNPFVKLITQRGAGSPASVLPGAIPAAAPRGRPDGEFGPRHMRTSGPGAGVAPRHAPPPVRHGGATGAAGASRGVWGSDLFSLREEVRVQGEEASERVALQLQLGDIQANSSIEINRIQAELQQLNAIIHQAQAAMDSMNKIATRGFRGAKEAAG